MTTQFTFIDCATYLVYKADWKNRYAQQAVIQRELKSTIRKMMRESGWPYAEQWTYIEGVRKVKALLNERAESKLEAARQWAKARSVTIS